MKRASIIILVLVIATVVIAAALVARLMPVNILAPDTPGATPQAFPSATDLGPNWTIASVQVFCDGRERMDTDYVNTTVKACEDYEREVKANVYEYLQLGYLVWNTDANAHAFFEERRADINTGTIENLTIGDESFLHAFDSSDGQIRARNAYARLGNTFLYVNMKAYNLAFALEPVAVLEMFVNLYTDYRTGT